VRDDALSLSLVASCVIHGAVIILASIILKHPATRQDFLPIILVEVPREEQPKQIQKIEVPPEIKKPTASPPKVGKPKEPKPVAKKRNYPTETDTASSTCHGGITQALRNKADRKHQI